ncbi:cache domain-containing protein [Poritiphilus flavus]|uniref:Calcium:proton antiporter n=1 Tax=Poritiphilus flavus TaxID=2697053 RepID=A0A6L9EC64_9FLAO|nr:cache domain-containing protein [Poritiphilus flavus]NAS12232.1 calcium:proton antiporter [Poritiphilus flavus]
MKKIHSFHVAIVLILLVSCAEKKQYAHSATPTEVVAKVRKAASHLEDKGLEGLSQLRDPNSEFSWKDTYVFSFNCSEDRVLANPAFPDKVGGDIKKHTDYNGFRYGLKMCEESDNVNGVWIEYLWPKPGGGQPLRKISYVITVKSLNIQVGAGIYNEDIGMAELNRLIQ